MTPQLHPAIEKHYSFLNENQKMAVAHTDGPLLIIAGPEFGKTLVLVVRTLNILLQGKAEPKAIVLCTFTEKAAFELRDRVAQAARTLGYTGDLSQLQVGTIHSICNDHLSRFRHHTGLGAGYEVLDELTQALFLFENFEQIVAEPDPGGKYLGKWSTYWTGEARREDALMLFPYEPDKVDEAGAYFDSVVARILTHDFAVEQRPETKVCTECDFRAYCQGQGTIRMRYGVAAPCFQEEDHD